MNDEMNAVTKWMYNNPEAFNMGIGLLKGIEEDRRNKALSGAEIAKTQYGYLTGAGTGDISNLSMNNIGKRTQQGAMAGLIQRRNSDFSNKLLDAIAAKKGKAPSRSPGSLTGPNDISQLDSKNEYNPILINPASEGESIDSRVRKPLEDLGLSRAPEGEGAYVIDNNPFRDAPNKLPFEAGYKDGLQNRRVASEEKAREESEYRSLMNKLNNNSVFARR